MLCIFPAPPLQIVPQYQHPPQSGTSFATDEFTLTHHNYPKTTVYVGLILGAVHSMASSKCITTYNDLSIGVVSFFF